jgi:hypothetical protein
MYKLTKLEHLTIAFLCLGLSLFEIIQFYDILTEPYMVGLLLFLACGIGFNLGAFLMKSK